MAKKIFEIEGMTCASCANAVERVTRKLEGVVESNVNLATEKLTISYDPDLVRVLDIKNAIEKAGYRAVDEEVSVDTDKERKENEIKSLWHRFVISAIFTIPLFYISMGHMIGATLPDFIEPMVNPLNFAIPNCLLTIPVMITGLKFYTIGFKTLFKKPKYGFINCS